MSKISTYEVAPVPKLSDKLIGTSVGGEIEDITYNFTLLELLELFLPVIPANNLQGVLDYGNTATQDINLFGTITTTNLEVTDTTNLFITYLNEETHLVGSLFDSADSVGTAGQVLTSTGDGVEWFTLPPIFTPNLEQVLTEGNTSSIDILLDANLEALDVSADTATVGVNLTLGGTITDNSSAVGSAGQVLSSTVTGVAWVSLPVYSATSPLLFNSATGVFSIQVANSTQGGYLTANDWVTFDGKQNAGAYITALTGEATATGPGSVPITLNNASVTAKVLTGLNVTGGSISASDSILTAFGKVQSQINGLMGGVQYQGVWDAATNTPTLTSSVGTQGHYYIVNVAGSTDLNGITDWKVGDWAIFSGGTWQKVDNTESVTSVNGQTGAVSLTTDNIPEGATNLYYLDSRARAALSFAAGSGAYNSLTGVITIPTNNNQILNGANYITLSSISATSPLAYNNLTGVFSIQQADATHDGYLSSTDWSTFNNKQNYLGGTGLVKSTAGTITYITDNSGNWNTAYNRSIVSAAVTGTTTKTLTLNEQDGNTITASWTDLDTGLTSVGVSMPSAFSVANSPLTSNGTIAVTGAGTTLEYIDGTGALRTFPGLTGYVPYTGATQNVNLGEFGISAGYFQADLTPTGALQVGRMQWNSTDGTMDLRLLGNNVTLQIGQENVTRVVNKSGIDLLEANYQVVRVRKVAEGGAQGQRLAVVLAQGNNENNSTEVLGLVTETINVNQEGFVTAFGEVKNIDTTGDLQGETWVDGDILYVSTTVPGQLTNIRPVAPNHAVTVGYVTYAHANNGKIYMAIDTGYELGELHNVYAPSPAANASIWWNTSTLRYENNTIAGILGYTPANPALYVPYTGATGAVNLGSNAFTTLSSITGGGLKTTNGVQIKYGDVGFGSDPDYLTIESYKASTVTSLRLADGDTLKSAILIFNNSVDYNYTFPNASGTLALTSDLTGGTVTSVAALTLGTSGTDLSSTVANPTTTPVITLNVPTASAANRGALSAADWSTFNTKVGGVTATSPLASSGGQTPNITIQQSSGSQDGYLSSTDWTTFNNKQAAGNYITSLTGEATGTGPGATAVTLNNASVTAKILTGINITGGTVQATDTMLTAFGKLQNQINGLIGSTIYQGTWNASTNTPALASGVGVRGYYYIVSVAGNTNLDGITDWFVGDWAIFDGTAWQQVDNTDAVVSVNGQTGAVSLTTDNIPEGATNQYFLNSRARAALSFTAGSGAYNSTTGVITIPTNNNQITNGANYITLASLSGTAPIVYSNTTGAISITQAGTASNGYLSSTDWNTFNNKSNTNGTVTSVAALTIGTTGTDLSSTVANSTTTPVITLNVPTASATNRGALSSADWTTFNNKQSALTNPVTGIGTANYITKWTSTSAVGNSALQEVSGNLGLNVTPPAWTYFKSINIGGSSVAAAGSTSVILSRNWYYDAAEKYYENGQAQRFELVGNGFYFQTAINNTSGAGAALTWVSAMTLKPTAQLQLNQYGSGTFTGTRAYDLAIDASGNIIEVAVGAGTVTGSGTTNYVPKWTSTSAIGNSQLFDNGTNVGIGLSDFGAFGLSLNSGWNLSFSEGGGDSYANIFRQRNSAATVIAHSLKRSTTAPFASSIGVSVAKAAIAVGWNAGSISFFSDPASVVANGTDFTASERMTIINNGNVGINNTTPTAQLHLNSGGSYTNTDANNRIIVERDSNTYLMFVSPNEFDQGIHFAKTTGIVGRIAYFQRAAGDSMNFSVASAIRMTLFSSGNLYVGTSATDSGYRLEVDGVGRFNDSLTVKNYLYVQPNVASGLQGLYLQNNNTGGYGVTLGLGLYGYTTGAYFSTLRIESSYPGYGRTLFYTKAQSNSTEVLALNLDGTGSAVFGSSVTATTLTSNTGLITSVGTNAFVDINGSTSGTLAGVRLYSDGSTKWIISHSTPSSYNFSIGKATGLTTFTEYLGINYSTGVATINNLAGTGTRMVVADASGVLSTQAVPTGTVTGTGVTNYVTKWTGTSSVGYGIIYDNGTTAMIGTTTVSSFNDKFKVVGGVSSNGLVRFENSVNQADGNHGTLQIVNTAAYAIGNDASIGFSLNREDNGYQDPRASIGAKTESSYGGALVFNTRSDVGTYSEKVRIVGIGNVLIGTQTDAGYKLDVNGTGRFTGIVTFGSTGGSGLRVYGGSGANQWDVYLSSTNLRFSDNTGTGSVVFDRPISGTSATFSANVSALRLVLNTTASYSSSGTLGYNSNDGNYIWAKAGSSSNFTILNDSGSSVFTLASTGAATISATDATGNRTNPFNVLTLVADNPNSPYEFFGGSILFNNRSYTHGIVSTSRIRSVVYDGGGSEGGGLTFETTPTAGGTLTPTMTLYYNGNVGIGNVLPTYKLDVNGTGRFTGTLTIGQTGVTNGIINSNDGMYFNIDADASGSTPEFMFGKGRSGSGSGGTTFLTIANTGAAIFNATDSTGNRTNPFNVLTITANNTSGPYDSFGGSVLFRNQSYYSGVVDSARIRSVIYNGGGGEGGGFIFETTPTSGGTLTPTMTLKYTGFVGIGTTTPTSLLHTYTTVSADNAGHIQYENGNTGATGNAACNAQLIGKSRFGTLQLMVWEASGIRFGMRSTANGGAGNIYFTTGTDSVKMLLTSGGNLLIGTTSDNGYTLQNASNTTFAGQFIQGGGSGRSTYGTTVAFTGGSTTIWTANSDCGDGGRFLSIVNENTSVNAFSALSFRVNPASGGSSGNVMLDMKFVNNGSVTSTLYWTFLSGGSWYDRMSLTSSGALTAGSFFESSDSRLKQLIKNDYKALGIESIKARLYLKDGKEEVGYYAQDLQSILPSAVSVNDAGFLSLSYTQVHTAKIAIIEDEVTILKRRVAELESKLQA